MLLAGGCVEAPESFAVALDVEGVYAFDVDTNTAEADAARAASEPWYIMQEDDWVLFVGPFGTFLTEMDHNGVLHADGFDGPLFTTTFEGVYADGMVGGRLTRLAPEGEQDVLEIVGEQHPWGDPTGTAFDVEGVYSLSGNILEQDCVSSGAQFSLFPSPFDFPSIVFQDGSALFFLGSGIRFQTHLNGDGTFELDQRWESRRGAFDLHISGAFVDSTLDATFEMTNDVFNNGSVNCSSVVEVYGDKASPWYDDEHLLDVLEARRMVYFTPLDFVLFH